MKNFSLDLNKKYVFIIGAGASKDDKLPVQDEILKNILKSKFALKDKISSNEYKKVSKEINELLKTFFNGKIAKNNISLEAIFNILETAVRKGENIGKIKVEKIKKYYDFLLEGIMFATLTDAKLQEHNILNTKSQSPYTILGRKIFETYKKRENINCSFITFNYDICLDRVLLSMYDTNENKSIDVDFGIELGNYSMRQWFHRPRKRKIYLLRPHGCINWFLCATCGKVFSRVSQQGKPLDLVNGEKCYCCGMAALEPYIIHPSNNRIYENKYITQVWDKVERLLFEADHWCFIGYSLPEADRYFTYLLTKIYNFRKIKQIKNNKKPKISVVNTNRSITKYIKITDELISNADNPLEKSELKKYFAALYEEKDVFKRFEVYFDDINKYECSFKKFTTDFFNVV